MDATETIPPPALEPQPRPLLDIHIRLPPQTVLRIDALIGERGFVGRSEALRAIIEAGLSVAAMTEFNPLLHLRPVNFRQGEHEPVAWDPAGPDNQPQSRLCVVLPGEIATAVVIKVVTRNAVIAQLGPCMMTGRGHSYKAKDIVPVRRENDDIGGERWTVVSDRELQQNEMIQRFEAIERALAYPAPGEPLGEAAEKAKALPSPEKALPSALDEFFSRVPRVQPKTKIALVGLPGAWSGFLTAREKIDGDRS